MKAGLCARAQGDELAPPACWARERCVGPRRAAVRSSIGPSLREESAMRQKVTPFLWFDTEAEEAAEHYTSIFPNSRITCSTSCGLSRFKAACRWWEANWNRWLIC